MVNGYAGLFFLQVNTFHSFMPHLALENYDIPSQYVTVCMGFIIYYNQITQ